MSAAKSQSSTFSLYKVLGIGFLIFGIISLMSNLLSMGFSGFTNQNTVYLLQGVLRNGVCIAAGVLLLLKLTAGRYALIAYGVIGALSQLYFFGQSVIRLVTEFSGYQIASFFSSCMYLLLGALWAACVIGLALSKELREEFIPDFQATGPLSFRTIGLLGAIYVVAPGLIEFCKSILETVTSFTYGYGGDGVGNLISVATGFPLSIAAVVGLVLLFMRNKIGAWIVSVVALLSSGALSLKWMAMILDYFDFSNLDSLINVASNFFTDIIQVVIVGLLLLMTHYSYKIYSRTTNSRNTAESILDGDFVER